MEPRFNPLAARAAGFSLLETLVALGILASGLVGVAALCATAARANQEARRVTIAASAAAQKTEQLRAFALGYDALGLPMTDTTSDASVVPATSAGGRGLLPSPGGSLITNAPGYVDYLDRDGQWIGTGSAPLPGTAYVRRWSIELMASDPANAVVLQVVVFAVRPGARALMTGQPGDGTEDVHLVAVKTRKRG
jgi:type II secretory pathway pseudopilin PulG